MKHNIAFGRSLHMECLGCRRDITATPEQSQLETWSVKCQVCGLTNTLLKSATDPDVFVVVGAIRL